MSADHEFEFKLSVSTTGFTSKPPKGDERVGKLKFLPRPVTIDSALQCALQGKAFCYTFATSNPKGVISMTDKTEVNFLGTSVIIYDFDGMDTCMEDFIASLNYKPSFAYQSYSNGVQGCGFRYRLAFVFDREVYGVDGFNALYHAIASANHFVKEGNDHGGWDVRNVSQFYYGTSSTAVTYKGEAIYTQEEFTPFIVASTEPDKHVSVSRSISKNITQIDPEFLKDFKHLPDKVLFAKYKEVYHQDYEQSLSTPLLLDDSEMFFRYPDDYVCVKHKRRGRYTHRWEIGEDRKKKMYITAQIMLFNLPPLTIENLLYNLRIERQWYYVNTDDKINNEFLIQTAISAFNKPYPLEPSKHPSFSLNKVFWEGQGYTPNQAKMIVRRYLKAKDVERFYNPSLSRKENLRVLRENGVVISDKTLQRMVTRGDIKIVKTNGKPTYLSCCPDDVTIQILSMIYKKPDVTQREIASHLGVCVRTVKRYMTEMKDLFIERFGDNHDGRWYLQPHGEYVLERHMFQISQGN